MDGLLFDVDGLVDDPNPTVSVGQVISQAVGIFDAEPVAPQLRLFDMLQGVRN